MTRDEFKNAFNALVDAAVDSDRELEQGEQDALCDAIGSDVVDTILDAEEQDESGDAEDGETGAKQE